MNPYLFKIRKPLLHLLWVLSLFFHGRELSAQTFTAHQNTPIGANCNGFYDYLPAAYTLHGAQKFPLLIALHGVGELGDGVTQLVNLTTQGIPKLINAGQFPATVTVSSGTYSFIVFAPQFINIPVLADVDAVVNYAIANYNIDPNRIYLTGYSMGGGAVWEYAGSSITNANKFSAIVPVSGAFPGPPDLVAARIISVDYLPVWATHNLNDPTVPSSNTITMVNTINQAPAPIPAAKMTIYNASVHDAWTQTYNPLYIDPNTGYNMYQWMLQYTLRVTVLPVTLASFDVTNGSNQSVLINWKTTEENEDQFFTLERSSDEIKFSVLTQMRAQNLQTGSTYNYTDANPLPGTSYYRLSVTDFNKRTIYFPIKEIARGSSGQNPLRAYPNPAGSSVFVQLDVPETGELNLSIINMAGITVQRVAISKQAPNWEQPVSLSGISKGMYILHVSGSTTSLNLPLLRE